MGSEYELARSYCHNRVCNWFLLDGLRVMKFKPEDFGFVLLKNRIKACDFANIRLHEIKAAWLEELKKSAVKVYGRHNLKSIDVTGHMDYSEMRGQWDTHSALLIDITKLEKKKCEHKPKCIEWTTMSHVCEICGVTLKATWGEA